MSDQNQKNTSRPNTVFAIPSSRQGINAVHVNAAREMVRLHTAGRNPPSRQPQPQQQPQPPSLSTSSTFPKVSIPLHHDETECKNPQCMHCGQIIIPSPQSSFPIQDKPSISVNDWSVYTAKRPILNSVELDGLAESKRFEFPLPEMIFGNNFVRVVHKDGGMIEFNALNALDSLDCESQLKVSYHEEWLKSRKSKERQKRVDSNGGTSKSRDLSEFMNDDDLKPYDWTYSTNYRGSVSKFDTPKSADKEIPIEKLTRPDPILFFDESILFEDELADNGISLLSYKIRVMPTCLLLLCRFFLRIDNVIFRIRDTRLFIDFETNELIREYKVQEDSYNNVLTKTHRKRITSRLTRSIHTVPKLESHKTWTQEGIPGLLSSKGYNTAWTDYQNYLLTNLTLLTNGTSSELKSPYETLLHTAKQTTLQHVFHYASMAHNNHFFFEQLTNAEDAALTKPSRFLMEKLMHQDVLDVHQLREKMLNLAENSYGQGWIFLVETSDKKLKFLNCMNDGTPYTYLKSHLLDLNGGINESNYQFLETMKQKALNDEKDYNLPILAINYWDYMYINDYGVTGKSEYLSKLWDHINWNVVNKRLFQL
ncbi:TIP41 Type 2A phosphatase activator TIP41 [Candida maltosa Xu316]